MEVSFNLLRRKLMQIKGPDRQSARQQQAAWRQDMKVTKQKPDRQLGPYGKSRKPNDDAAEQNCRRVCEDLSVDAETQRLLDALLQVQSGTCSGHNVTEESIALSGCSEVALDDLIYLSAKMRGLIFRAYARQISDLLISGGRNAEGRLENYRLN